GGGGGRPGPDGRGWLTRAARTPHPHSKRSLAGLLVRGPRGLGGPAGPGRLGPPAGGGPEKEVIHWIVAVWLRWRWRPRRGTRTLWRLMSSLHGNPAPPRPNVLGPGPQGPGPDFSSATGVRRARFGRSLQHELPRLHRLAVRREPGEEHAARHRVAALAQAVPRGAERPGRRVLVHERAHHAALRVEDAQRHACARG